MTQKSCVAQSISLVPIIPRNDSKIDIIHATLNLLQSYLIMYICAVLSGIERTGMNIVLFGSAFNTTVDHCTSKPYLPPHNMSCVVHLNHYVPDPNITLHFQ